MSLVEINWEPSTKQLRQFGTISFAALPLITWWWSGSLWAIVIAAVVGALVLAASWVAPKLVRPIFVGLSLVTLPLGIVIGWLAMVLIFALLFVPMALLFRMLGRDRLEREVDRERKSYWQAKRPAKSLASYYRQS